MKKILILAVFALVTIEVNAQKMTDGKVPSAVKESFAKQYPNVKTVKWDKEDADYEASFKMDGKDMSVVLDGKGVEKEVETDIKFSELPMPVQTALKGKKVKEEKKSARHVSLLRRSTNETWTHSTYSFLLS